MAEFVLERSGDFDPVIALFAAHYAVGAALYAAWIGDEDMLRELWKREGVEEIRI